MNSNWHPRESGASLLPCLVLILMIITVVSVNSDAAMSSGEYLSHLSQKTECVSAQCHAQFLQINDPVVHGPVREKKCGSCHALDAFPGPYGVEQDLTAVCSGCHKHMEEKIGRRKYVHRPVINGDCAACHDPHSSGQRFLLRKPYSELCATCHKLARLFKDKFTHKPVTDGNCGICHDPHASDVQWRLTDSGANVCLSCHEDMLAGMAEEHVHTPILKSGCTGCHDPHSGSDRLRLKTSPEQLCFECHEEKQHEILQYAIKHEPAVKGRCVACHSPHYSHYSSLLRERVDALCYSCHQKSAEWQKKRFLHGPVVQGNCAACHNPHGSDYAFILRLAFPHKFYAPYTEATYDLCFLCHKEALVNEEKTMTATRFRNRETNLHNLHVHREKGRTCRACHDVHASDQEGRIRDEFPFGSMSIPMYYFKNATGGRCIPGCHKERSYSRN